MVSLDKALYLVGDSTIASFDDGYYYPRYGYGTQIPSYLSDKITVINLALSGRSSKSFLAEENYTVLKNSLKKGDILVIGFGHNDEKSEDEARFTDATLSYTDPRSFGYHLYEYYIKLARERGAVPVLCTPIVRANSNDDYSALSGHKTPTGDYSQVIRDLGCAEGVTVVDMTALTRERYKSIGYSEAMYYHAIIEGKYDPDGVTVVPDLTTVDTTHLNIYGAKYMACLFVSEMDKIGMLSEYILPHVCAPTMEDLICNPNYTVSEASKR